MKKFYFTLRSYKTGNLYYKTISADSLAQAVQVCNEFYPNFVQVSIKEI